MPENEEKPSSGKARQPVKGFLANCCLGAGPLGVVFGGFLVDDGLLHGFLEDLREVLIGAAFMFAGAWCLAFALRSCAFCRKWVAGKHLPRFVFATILLFGAVEMGRYLLKPRTYTITPGSPVVPAAVDFTVGSRLGFVHVKALRPCRWYETSVRVHIQDKQGGPTKEVSVPKKHVVIIPGVAETEH